MISSLIFLFLSESCTSGISEKMVRDPVVM